MNSIEKNGFSFDGNGQQSQMAKSNWYNVPLNQQINEQTEAKSIIAPNFSFNNQTRHQMIMVNNQLKYIYFIRIQQIDMVDMYAKSCTVFAIRLNGNSFLDRLGRASLLFHYYQRQAHPSVVLSKFMCHIATKERKKTTKLSSLIAKAFQINRAKKKYMTKKTKQKSYF